MAPTEKPQFVELLAAVYSFYRQDTSPFALGIWWEAMRPFDFAAVKDALNRHVVDPDRGQFAPKPADVVRRIRGGTQDTALMAWAEVMRTVREVGTYRSVTFADPIIGAVIRDMGGWPAIGKVPEEELPFKAREFENRYRGYVLRAEQIEPVKLLGIADQDNASKGFAPADPVQIGRRKETRMLEAR